MTIKTCCHGLLPAVVTSIVGTDVRCLNGFGTALETIDQLIRVRNDPVISSEILENDPGKQEMKENNETT